MAIRFTGDKKFLRQKAVLVRKRVPAILEDMAVRSELHYNDSFKNEGFTDESLQKWPKRKSLGRADEMTRTSRRNILVKSGKMRNSTRVRKERNQVVVSNNAKSADGFPYPKVHNEGLGKMPKRQFIGNSRRLNSKIKKDIAKHIKQALGLR